MKNIIIIILALFIISGCENVYAAYTLNQIEKGVLRAMKADNMDAAEELFKLYVAQFKQLDQEREEQHKAALKICNSQDTPLTRLLEREILTNKLKRELSK